MAKIIGNVTATPNPKPDWNQTDENKADYIKNKPFESIDDTLSASSTNPVQNNVLALKFARTIQVQDQSFTDDQKKIARQNIGAASADNLSTFASQLSTTSITVNQLQKKMNEINSRLYTPIDITSFSAGQYEVGQEVRPVLSWTINRKPTKLTLNGEEIEAKSIGTHTSQQAISADHNPEWILWAEDIDDTMRSEDTWTCRASFNYAVYYGASDLEADEIDSDFITSNFTKVIRGSNLPNFEVNSADAKYIYYVTPYSVNKFNVGGFDGGFDEMDAIEVVNQYEKSKEYHVHRSTNKLSGKTTVYIT